MERRTLRPRETLTRGGACRRRRGGGRGGVAWRGSLWFGEESEGGVAVDDGLQVGEGGWIGRINRKLASGAVVLLFLRFFPEIFGGFGDEEGGGEGVEEVGFRVRIRV
ncbi:hypothetical protein LOK49_Contig724G00001 [Camellia lanceoleosa]|nr:hypothetical protein LOK49_Contig724G00001 [Camellia lanceoleosa]